MENDFIEMMEPTPKLHSKKCKLISFTIRIFLQFFIYIVALIVWLLFDYFIAIATLLLSFIIMGIIRSKIRNSVIPSKQREYQYSDQGIADWFTSKELCFEDNKE
ncbi:hypothetical protein [Sulfurimonas sp. CS5]|uniref:hypothetical protein n=1 Tax=Sulfurimonas sp. CS5 TaxID=3391145 RepID=UPI0039E79ED4